MDLKVKPDLTAYTCHNNSSEKDGHKSQFDQQRLCKPKFSLDLPTFKIHFFVTRTLGSHLMSNFRENVHPHPST
ncbi:hypothetical protein FRX31_016765 [Thalictrum thalictroides]|uniref:Uncharacterized protein n=1 Tax=Thalictrum thalictroides TaxID=46969 RepID=A0A7J6W9W7_THATH|nr:hypothetical protein FRX31_016765 [Thalictrum thalictroides]